MFLLLSTNLASFLLGAAFLSLLAFFHPDPTPTFTSRQLRQLQFEMELISLYEDFKTDSIPETKQNTLQTLNSQPKPSESTLPNVEEEESSSDDSSPHLPQTPIDAPLTAFPLPPLEKPPKLSLRIVEPIFHARKVFPRERMVIQREEEKKGKSIVGRAVASFVGRKMTRKSSSSPSPSPSPPVSPKSILLHPSPSPSPSPPLSFPSSTHQTDSEPTFEHLFAFPPLCSYTTPASYVVEGSTFSPTPQQTTSSGSAGSGSACLRC
ncbi:hypothetical protein BDY24DRAFT_181716 [Mrakia frigida]|uniref:uncharacterized protein n=1 Tax=Mrakia frigida TaxID=29902 RepID=UPI003FCBFAF6